MDASIVIRTYNEERHLPALLASIATQKTGGLEHEVLVVDSGSTDGTVGIARERGCRLLTLSKDEFSFGRSLNIGCREALGRYLVFVSGHCIPVGDQWLRRLLAPLIDGAVALVYGRQVGGDSSRFSECRIFEKYYPAQSRIPQDGFFCNNANAALPRPVWEAHRFDEDLTGLEDMCLGKRLTAQGLKLGYAADAVVLHLHDESWRNVRMRFEREAIALQHIMPEIHLGVTDFMRYLASAVLHDCADALQRRRLFSRFPEILMYRTMQYWGAYRGNHAHRRVSRERKERYFYPR
jgi:glycosyltransferase involved in cell wall biosynthesis